MYRTRKVSDADSRRTCKTGCRCNAAVKNGTIRPVIGMKQLSLQEIHIATLEMMDYIHQICEENHITYYLAYGTLIGAVRHGGFIPWDDDFDIQMPREDFERFRGIFRQKQHPYYRLCDRKNTKDYPYGIPRFSDSRFSYRSERPGFKPFDTGLFIDIYPLDNFGNTYGEARQIKKKVDRKNLLYEVYLNETDEKGKASPLVRKLCHKLLRIRYGSRYSERIDDEVRRLIRRNTSPDDSQIGDVSWDTFYLMPYPREWFAEKVLHGFDGRQYWIPAEYDKILRADYGDYMELPPEEKRIPQHEYTLVRK